MHASLAYVNGAGSADRDLRLLNTLLAAASEKRRPPSGKGKESKADKVSKRAGFKNDPNDPTNPNEVRERHLKKIKR